MSNELHPEFPEVARAAPPGADPVPEKKAVKKLHHLVRFAPAAEPNGLPTVTFLAGGGNGFRTKEALAKFAKEQEEGEYFRMTLDTKPIKVQKIRRVVGL